MKFCHRIRRGRGHTELVNAEDQNGLVDLEAEDLWLDERERLAVDLDESLSGLTIPLLAVSSCLRAVEDGFRSLMGAYLAVSDSCVES